MAQMRRGTELFILGVIVIIGAMIASGQNVPFLSDLFGTAGDVDDTGAPVTKVEITQPDKACGSTTMTVDFEVAHKSGTDVTAQNATVWINGARRGIFSEGSTFTAQGGDTLRVYNALDPAQTDYLTSYVTGTIPCTGQTAAFMTSADFMSVGSGSSLQKVGQVYESNTAASIATLITDTNQLNNANAQAIGTGDTRHLTVKLFPVFEEGYGVADGNTIACRFTDSQIDQSGTEISLNGKVLGGAKYIPTNTRFSLNSGNESTKYWHLSPIDGKTTSVIELDLAIKGDDNNNPDASTNFSCEVFGTDYYEADDKSVNIDVEDRDDNNKIGRTAANEFSWNANLS